MDGATGTKPDCRAARANSSATSRQIVADTPATKKIVG
jgi:hypothetical protein